MKKRYFVIAVYVQLHATGAGIPLNLNMDIEGGRYFSFAELHKPIKHLLVQQTQDLNVRFSYMVTAVIEMSEDDFKDYTAPLPTPPTQKEGLKKV